MPLSESDGRNFQGVTSRDRAIAAAKTALDYRANDVVILDLRALTSQFDYFVIVSGTSRRQLHGVSEEIDHVLENQLGDKRLSIAGFQESKWIVLDYGDIVIHLFEPETREFYALEELWGKGVPVPINDSVILDSEKGHLE
ncbi:MAG: ribosome silencing factor [Planctomycetaceae bacterium]|nr:ribosome silencing factor [Planctomycetaceae bacterium]